MPPLSDSETVRHYPDLFMMSMILWKCDILADKLLPFSGWACAGPPLPSVCYTETSKLVSQWKNANAVEKVHVLCIWHDRSVIRFSLLPWVAHNLDLFFITFWHFNSNFHSRFNLFSFRYFVLIAPTFEYECPSFNASWIPFCLIHMKIPMKLQFYFCPVKYLNKIFVGWTAS